MCVARSDCVLDTSARCKDAEGVERKRRTVPEQFSISESRECELLNEWRDCGGLGKITGLEPEAMVQFGEQRLFLSI